MKVDIYIRINETEDNGNIKPFNIYNEFTFNQKIDVEDFELLIKDICDAINRGEARNKVKELGENIYEE